MTGSPMTDETSIAEHDELGTPLSASPSDTSSGSDHDDRSPIILYATETGNAQDCADRIARECRRIAFRCRVVNIVDYDLSSLLTEPLAIFVLSTSGSGREPRAATPLFNLLLRSDLPPDLFDELSFGFCWPAKVLGARLRGLGANEVVPRGEGDEQHAMGIDGALEPWMQRLLDTLMGMYPTSGFAPVASSSERPPPRVTFKPVALDGPPTSPALADPLAADPDYFTATLSANRRLTAEDWWQDVRHFDFAVPEGVQYRPGDAAVVHPEAAPADVEAFLDMMGWINRADECFELQHSQKDQTLPALLPHTSTLRQLFTRYVDFNTVPRRGFFDWLRYFTTDELERERIGEFLGDGDDLYDYTTRVRRTIAEVLADFRNVRIPPEYVFDVFPPMRPREFSIASSIQRHPRQIQLCIAIVRYRTKLKVPRRGVCTSWLVGLPIGSTLRMRIARGLIELPPTDIPVICVGPGTGIAPMRAVIEERLATGAKDNTLYFGCRSAAKDEHYAEEWAAYARESKLTYRVARSRDGPEGTARIYVQDLMREDASRLVLISGSSNKMPAAVRAALAYVAEMQGGYNAEEAKSYVERMEREGRLVEECWS
ncbi:riboflavin synthase domain-like protein [Schizophyllum amplum]|uniref:Riboflavin synthase domain-like protein n=1 Tax=Schizophyllum amplum TaxID=97359 RepID=A0A550C1X1_9AGAR|nr:riboflavin synthase domain-like protein [Auriculariopsis ampla]